jgi:HEAT repeat protein
VLVEYVDFAKRFIDRHDSQAFLEFNQQKLDLLAKLTKHRNPTLIAGRNAGASFEKITAMLDDAHAGCAEFAYGGNMVSLIERVTRNLKPLGDLIILAQDTPGSGELAKKAGSHESGLAAASQCADQPHDHNLSSNQSAASEQVKEHVPSFPTSVLHTDSHDRVCIVEDESDETYLRTWMERILPSDQWQRLSTGMVFHHTRGRPTGGMVNQKLDAIRQTYAEVRNFQPMAFVLADRDYKLDDELQADHEQLKSKAFARQIWHVWQRVEIENYLVCPSAIVRLIVGRAKSVEDKLRFPSPQENELRELIEQTIESSREAARNHLVDAFEKANKGHTASTRLTRAERFLLSLWQGEVRIDWCDAKEVVLPKLKQECKRRWNVSLSDQELIRSLLPEEIPAEMIQVVHALASFFAESYWLRLYADEREAVRPLVEALKNRDPRIRREAAEALGEKKRAALPALSKALNDEDVEVRRVAASSLERIGQEAAPAVPALTKALRDVDGQVRQNATSALSIIGPPARTAVPQLVECMEKDPLPSVRQGAAAALGRIGETGPAVRVLTEGVTDPDMDLRVAACDALGRIGSASVEAIPQLLTAIKEMHRGSESVRQNAAFALGRIGQATQDILRALSDTLKDPHRDPRRFAARALGDLGPGAKNEVEALIDLLDDQEMIIRADAAEALGKIGGPPTLVLPALVARLQDEDWRVRAKAAEALGRLATEAKGACPELEHAAERDISGVVRVESAAALAKIRGQTGPSIPILGKVLVSDEDLNAREAAAEALGTLGAAALPALPALVQALKDGHYRVRCAAAYTIGELGPVAAPAVSALAAALLDDRQWGAAIGTLTWAEGPVSDSVRYLAANALGKIGPDAIEALPALREAYKYQRAVRTAVEEAIARIEQPAGPAIGDSQRAGAMPAES